MVYLCDTYANRTTLNHSPGRRYVSFKYHHLAYFCATIIFLVALLWYTLIIYVTNVVVNIYFDTFVDFSSGCDILLK